MSHSRWQASFGLAAFFGTGSAFSSGGTKGNSKRIVLASPFTAK